MSTTLLLCLTTSVLANPTPAPDHQDLINPHASPNDSWETSRTADTFWAIVAIFGILAILGYAMWRAGICNINEAALQPSTVNQNRQTNTTFTIGSLLKSMGNSGPGGASNAHYSRIANDEDEDFE